MQARRLHGVICRLGKSLGLGLCLWGGLIVRRIIVVIGRLGRSLGLGLGLALGAGSSSGESSSAKCTRALDGRGAARARACLGDEVVEVVHGLDHSPVARVLRLGAEAANLLRTVVRGTAVTSMSMTPVSAALVTLALQVRRFDLLDLFPDRIQAHVLLP